MSRNWLGIAERTVAAVGLVALLSGCDGIPIQDGDAGKAQPTVAAKSDDPNKKPKHEVAIEIFGKKYDATTTDNTQLLEDLRAKLGEATATDKQLQGHLRNQDLDAFLRDYKISQEIVDTLVHVHSLPFARYFEVSLQNEAKRKLGPKDNARDVYQPFLNGGNFLSLKNDVHQYVEARGPFGILFANLTQNQTKPKEYAGLEYCCADTESQTFAGKLKSFGTNYTKEQRGGTSPVGSWELMVVFDDDRLKAMKSREEERLPAGEFVKLQYDEPSDMFSFCYTKRTKPNGRGNTTFTEREFQVVDLGIHGTLSSSDARLNGIHPEKLVVVNAEYKNLLQRTLAVVETRYEGKFIR